MAKKKLTHHHHHHENGQDKAKPGQHDMTHQPNSMDGSEEKLENLKSLNSMLLKETVDRRQQVHSLQRSNISLESHLSQSEMERERLSTELDRSIDGSLCLELEKSLVGVFLSSQMDGFREISFAFVDEKEGLVRDKEEREKRVEGLERELREVRWERDEIVKKGKSEIKSVKAKVEQLVAALEVEGDLLRRVNAERDSLKGQLSTRIEEANVLRREMLELEESKAGIQESHRKLEMEFKGLTLEKDEKELVLQSLARDKRSVELRLEDSLQMMEGLKREVQVTIEDKRRIEEVNGSLETRIYHLQKELEEFNEAISSLRKEVSVLGEIRDKATKRETQMGMEINGLVERIDEKQRNVDVLMVANQESQRSIDLLMREKEVAVRNLGESLNQVEAQKREIRELVREKSEVEDAKVQQESRLVELGSKVDELTYSISTLQRLCTDHETKNKELNENIESYKKAVDQLTLEKNIAIDSLDNEKRTILEMKSCISEAEKKLDELLKVLECARNEYSALTKEKIELEGQYEMSIREKKTVEENLIDAQKEVEFMRTMLLRISTLLSHAGDDLNGERDMVVNVHKIEEGNQPFVAELNAINKAIRDRATKAGELKQQVDVLQKSVANERKQKSFWTMISSAATILAAVSVAYAAKVRW